MKKTLAILSLAGALGVQADVITVTPLNGTVPDGNLSGWLSSTNVSGLSGTITDLDVTLNLSGGWNGDLYGYLVHDSGFSVLVNRVGVTTDGSIGYGNAGMNVTLDDAATLNGNIHSYGGASVPTGLWQPDGRNISPLTAGSVLGGTPSTALLGSFNGLNPNGVWTLFMADVAGGGVTTVDSWVLTVIVVPEPSAACIVLAGAGIVFVRNRRRILREREPEVKG